jgi:hypothetical protein
MILILALLLYIFLVLPIFIYKKRNNNLKINCSINPSISVINKNDGFIIINNILNENCRKQLVDRFFNESKINKNLNENKNLEFYSNDKFLFELSKIVGEKLYPVNSLDLQRCWLRYYYEGMKAQYYEHYHHDIKRYNSKIKQYRLVISLYDTSDTIFSIKNYGEFPFKQNMAVFLEANNCLHKLNFTKGERFVLIMDFITKDCDSLYNHYNCRESQGYYLWVRDTIWRYISSTYYKLVNL